MKRWEWGRWFIAGLLLAGLAGCDDFGAGDERFAFQETVTFRFAFQADTLQVGETARLNALAAANLTQALQNRGFVPADVSGAQVQSGKLEVLFPLSEPINFLQQVTLALIGTAGPAVEVANQAAFPGGGTDEVALSIIPDQNVAASVADPQFSAQLAVRPATLTPGEAYELAVELVLRLEIDAGTP